jgi:pyruvate kinase
VSDAVVEIGEMINVSNIVVFTQGGMTARMISRFKPLQPILAFTPDPKTAAQLSLSFGCHPVVLKTEKNLKVAFTKARAYMLKNKHAKKGDKVIITAGWPLDKKLDTNMLVVETL